MVYWNMKKGFSDSTSVNSGIRRRTRMYSDLCLYIDNLVSWDFYYKTFGIDTRYFHGMGFTRDEYLYFLEFGSLDGFSI